MYRNFYYFIILSLGFCNNYYSEEFDEIIIDQEKTIDQLEEFLINKVKDKVLLDDKINIDALTDIINNYTDNNYINIDDLMELFYKTKRCSTKILQLENRFKLSKINLIKALQCFDISNQTNYPLVIEKINNQLSKSQNNQIFQNDTTISWSFNQFFNDFLLSIVTFYIDCQKNYIDLVQEENNLFNKLTNEITEYNNNRLQIFKNYIKILHFHYEIKIYIQLKKNIGEEEFIKKIQKLAKYLDKIFQCIDSMEKSFQTIQTMTGDKQKINLCWNIYGLHKKLFWKGNISSSNTEELIINFQKQKFNKTTYHKLLYNLLYKHFNQVQDHEKFLKILDKVMGPLIMSNNIESLYKKEYYLNNLKSFINIFFNITMGAQNKKQHLNKENFKKNFKENFQKEFKDLLDFKKYNLSITYTVSLQKIITGFISLFENHYKLKENLLNLQNQSTDLYFFIYQLIKSLDNIETKINYIKNKNILYLKKINIEKDKVNILLKNQDFQYHQISFTLNIINELVENNHRKKIELQINFALRNIDSTLINPLNM